MSAVRPGLVRLAFLLVAGAALVGLYSQAPRMTDAEHLERTVGFGGMLITSLGMLLPWGSWFVLVSPGEDLGLVTQVIGWICAGVLPFAVVTGSVLEASLCVIAIGSALATWKERTLAAWAWYALAAVVAVCGGVNAVRQFLEAGPDWPSTLRLVVGRGVLGCSFLYWYLREVEAWRRKQRAPEPSAGPASVR